MTRCSHCGHTLKCERCEANLTFMYSKKILTCRHCNYRRALPKVCPQCHKNYLKSTGSGSEKLESEVSRLYPQARISHYDRDSQRWPSEAQVIIVTQAVFRKEAAIKAHWVAVLQFDSALSRGDFRGSQKAFSLLIHLRRMAQEGLLVQTRMMDNECLKAAANLNFDQFYNEELKTRKDLEFPPYRHFIAVELRAKNEETVLQQSQQLFERLTENLPKTIDVLDPQPNPIPKLRDTYRYTIMLKTESTAKALEGVKGILKNFKRKTGTIIAINVDP